MQVLKSDSADTQADLGFSHSHSRRCTSKVSFPTSAIVNVDNGATIYLFVFLFFFFFFFFLGGGGGYV